MRQHQFRAGAVAFAISSFLVACSNPGGNDSVLSGAFVDHPVEGLEYATATQAGLLDRQGGFRYRPGETVRFRLGGIDFGAAPAAAVLTPLDLGPQRAAINMARLLQTLDEDCFAANGLRLSPQAQAAAQDVDLDFDQPAAAFGSDPAVQAFVQAARGECPALIGATAAQATLQQTLDYLAATGGVANRLPSAGATAPASAVERSTVTLAGTATDEDGTIVSRQWTQLGDGNAVTLSGADTLSPSFVAPSVSQPLTLEFRLRVTDNAGGVADAVVAVSIVDNSAQNRPPVVSAGDDDSVNEGAAVTLAGTASDPDGNLQSVRWSADPANTVAVTLAGADTLSASFTAPAVAAPLTLRFVLTATDTDGVTATDSVVITVNDVPPPNLPPVADAGEDLAAIAGALVQLDGGNSSDEDGSIVSYSWEQRSGPAVQIATGSGGRASFTAPTRDRGSELVFRLTVTDDDGATANDEVTVKVRGTQFFAVTGGERAEGDTGSGPLDFTVSLARAESQTVTVGYETQALTATAGDDYVPAAGTLSFAPGETQKTVTVAVRGDREDENDETVGLRLKDAGDIDIAGPVGAGLIRDDDSYVFQVGTGEGNHDPTGRVCFGSGSMCSRSADPSADGEEAFRRNQRGGYDHLISKATAITGANGETFILVTTTNIGYFLAYKAEQHGLNGIYDVRLRIARATGVPSTNIVVVSDHSHNGPDTIGIWGGVSAEYMKITADAVVEAAVEAVRSRRPAVLKAASVNGNAARLPGIPALDSSYDLPPGNDPARGNPYNEFRLLTADDALTGQRILTFVNYAPHATVTNGDTFDGKYKLTGDWTAWAPQETEARWPGSLGLAAIGTVGGTDWNKSGDIPAREAEARARLNRLIDAASVRLQPLGSDTVAVHSTFIREPMLQPILLANYKPGLDRNTGQLPQDGRDLRIDRSVSPPFLTGTVVGTYVSAIRIGDVFISTFPGEPFGELDHAIKEEGRVLGAREYFLLGGANDFFGYMVKNPETYQQTLGTGALWLAGCPDEDFARQVGYREEGEGACSDHWTLMVSPTIGQHIVCTLQDSADRLGFQTANRDAECPALTALDGMAGPPESGDPLADNPALAREAAVTAARTLAAQCREQGAPAALCDALDEGARQAAIYAGAGAAATPPADGQARAGVAIKDASWHLGASAGQFAATGVGLARDKGYDPYGHSVRKVGSDTLGTRITTRALVVEGRNGKRVAVVSNDLYLPNDLLHRRTSQLLAEHDLRAALGGGAVTGITDQNLSTTSSHSHTSPFYSSPSWGTWIFQDVMDLRFYEYMARQMADAVIEAASRLVPVRMGGATVKANDVQAHTYGPGAARDGTPAGQPRDYTTQAVTIVRFDDISAGAPKPLANWVIFGVHPEWVWGEEVVNGDITHAVMRMLDRETGAVTLWSQRETGSSGPHKDERVHRAEARHEFQESNFSGYDRAARMLTDSIHGGLDLLAGRRAPTPFDRYAPYQTGFEVDFASQRFAPPATRPYPGISNCNTDRALEDGEVGTVIVPGLPDCSYDASDAIEPIREPFWDALPAKPAELLAMLADAGVPLPVPTSYSGTSLTAVQETAAVHLQAFKLGTIAATMAPNEQFTSQALNIESRLDKIEGNRWNGYDFACLAQARGLLPLDPEGSEARRHCALQNARYPGNGADGTVPVQIAGDLNDPDMPRARAQIHNDAAGWELDPVYAAESGDTEAFQTLGSEAEPAEIERIKGNFTHEEFTAHGYDLVVSVGMANDYWGYMAEYREYRAHSNAYRKALNALGPHGADFVATRLARMAANLNGAGVALPFNPFDAAYQAEAHRADALARTIGQMAQAYSRAFEAGLPPDGGAPRALAQPSAQVKRFSPALFQFVGGSNYEGTPIVTVERLVNGRWQTYGTQEGEVQLQLRFLPAAFTFNEEIPGIGERAAIQLPDPQALAAWASGGFEWIWTANFEAFISELDNLGARPGITPAGQYRFVAQGRHRSTPGVSEYRLVSDTFEVVPWDGITVESPQLDADNRLSFQVGPINTVTRFRRGLATDAGSIDVVPGLVVGPIDYPDSYDGGLGWIRNERQLAAGDEQYCARCSFRPWADTAAVAVNRIPVTVERRGAQGQVLATRTLNATLRDNGRWITDGVIEDGETAFVPARVIVDEYGERNGAASAGVTRDDSIPRDSDGDGVPDSADLCPAVPGTGADGCPVPPPPPLRDTDGDGVIDAVDRCATRAGPAERAGCPDDTPSLADACDAFGVDEASPLCGGLRDAADEFRGQCEDFGGPAELCVLSTGNLHTLVEACYANAGDAPLPLCRAVDAFTGGAAAACRAAARDSGQPPELCALVDGVAVSEAALQRYEASWVHRALTLQNRLGYGQRLLDSVLLHTHNSFNAPGENRPQTLSGSDYNQLYGVHDQLRMGIRAIELDVHWMPGAGGSVETQGFEPKLCHGYTSGGAPHVGCTTEEPLGPVLADIRAWLDANPGEVIALYLEDHFTETAPDVAAAYAETSRVLQAELGARIWRSGLGCDNSDPVAWLRKSRDEIRTAGAQVLIFGESCDDTGSAWNSMVHVKKDANIHQGTQSSYQGLSSPSCQLPDEAAFITGSRGLRWTRVWEDSTLVSNVAGGGVSPASITPEVMRELARCGLNLPGFDRLHPADGRLEAAIWSWAANEPVASTTKNCAMQDAEGRFVAADCDGAAAYACVSTTNASDWRVSGQGRWSGGASACPAGYRFSVPATGYQNERLKAARPQGTTSVWLNYTDAAADGVWTGDAVAAPGGPPRPPREPTVCGQLGLPEALCEWAEELAASGNPWMERKPLNISHRGGADEFPENTLFAYVKSLGAGSDMIEADVYETADGELVVIHDATVDRTTNGSGDVSSFTLAQLKQLDAAHCYRASGGAGCGTAGASFPYRGMALDGGPQPPAGFTRNDFRIPTLRELLERFPTTLINLELKPDPDSFGSYEGKLAAILREYGRTDDVIVASFLDNAALAFKAQAPRVSTSVPTVQVAASVATGQGPGPGLSVGHDAYQVPVEFSGVPVVDRNFVEDAHARQVAVHVWTIDDCGQMYDLLELGVDGIMTDRPSLLARVLDERADGRTREQVCGAPPPEEPGSPIPDFGGQCRDFLGDAAAPLCNGLSGLGAALTALTDGSNPGYDQCAGPLCLSQLPVLGNALLRVLAPLLAPPSPDGVWLRTDLHVHDDHSSDGSGTRQTIGQGGPGNMPVRDQLAYSEAVGLDFLALTDHRTFDQHYDPEWTSDRLLLITGEEANGSPHATVFGALDTINQSSGAGLTEARRLQQSIWDSQLQGAVWSHAHPADGQVNADGSLNDFAQATGQHLVEGWKRSNLPAQHLTYCENRWNQGWRFGLSGGSDNHFKEVWPIAGPGTPLVWVFAKERSTAAVLDALRAGRTVLTLNDRAPFATLTGDFDRDGVFEVLPGDEARVVPGKAPRLKVTVRNGAGNTVTVLRAPGMDAQPYATFTPVLPEQSFEFDVTDARAQDWFRVEVRGPGEISSADYEVVLDGEPQNAIEQDPLGQLHALTSPLFLYTGTPAQPASTLLPAVAGTDDSEPLFGELRDNAFAGFASIAEADGVIHAVAEVRSGGESRVQYRRLQDGILSDPVDLAGSAYARHPRIAAAAGHVWVVWQDSRAGEVPHRSQIWARHSDSGGLGWAAAVPVSAATGRAERPAIALVNPLQPAIAWQQIDGGAFDIWTRVLGADAAPQNVSAAGKTVVAGNGVDSRSAIHPASVSPAIAVRPGGQITVAWEDNRLDSDPGWTGRAVDPTNPDDLAQSFEEQELREAGTEVDDWEIFVAQRPAGAGSWSAPLNISKDSTRADRHAALGVSPTGQFLLHAAWDAKRNDGSSGRNLSIRTARYNTAWTDSVVVDEAPNFSAQRPAFGRMGRTRIPDGEDIGERLHLLWMDGRGADWRWRVRRVTLEGTSWVNPRDLTTGGNAGWPAYASGYLAYTSDRDALREQRKPQQVWLLQVPGDSLLPDAAAAGQTGTVTVTPPAPDVCDPVTGALCLSLLPEPLAGALRGLLGGGDPSATVAAAIDPAIAACRESGAPESLCARAVDVAGGAGLWRYVEPRIGSVAPGFTNPGPQRPFGLVAVGPDTEGPANYGGYYIQNALISGFSHVHMSAGVYKGGYFPLLPFTGQLVRGPAGLPLEGPSDHPMPAYSSGFEHASESADVGYYAVTLARYGVLAELTSTERVGLHRYTFTTPAQPARVLIDASRTLGGYRQAQVRLRDAQTLTGWLSTGRFPVYFALQASQPFTVTDFGGAPLGAGAATAVDDTVGAILDFAGAPNPVLVKVAISYTDEAGAIANLAELPGWDFDAVRDDSRAAWDALLGRVEVQGGSVAERVSFYSAIYRALQFPNLHSDVDGRYRGPDGEVHDDDARPHYSQFSSWDSYRGQNQLQAEIIPDEYQDMIRSLLDFHAQAGFLPRWQEASIDASHMSGDPIIPFIGEAWCRGQLDDDLRARLWPAMQNLVSRRDPQLAQLGYLAVPGPQPFFDASPLTPLNDVQRVIAQLPEVGDGTGRAGTTLEYGIADFALALMAQDRAPAAVQDTLMRSQNYRNLIDEAKAPADRWVQPRLASGAWSPMFLPESGYGFQEGTSWQYSWLAMHDYAGLFERMGGDAAVQQRLDTFFNLPAVLATPVAWPAVQNQITAFGVLYLGNQFAPGNEHDVQAPYAYVYAGAPWKAQVAARAAASIYTPAPNGLPGNDDLGALSGWLVWTMAGLYPMNPGTPLAVVGSPHFERVTFKRPRGDLVIEAPGASPVNKYVQALSVDGVDSPRPWLGLPQTRTVVRMEVGPAPALDWGAAAGLRPPSASTHSLAEFACRT